MENHSALTLLIFENSFTYLLWKFRSKYWIIAMEIFNKILFTWFKFLFQFTNIFNLKLEINNKTIEFYKIY